MRAAIPAAAAILLLATATGAGSMTLEAYAWPVSVAQGETVGVYVSTDQPFFNVFVSREGASSVSYATYLSLPGPLQAVPDSAWATGCGWAPSLLIPIPESWPSGVYYALVAVPGLGSRYAIFTVRESQPGSTARILFQNSVTTWQAYNNWGGKSLYNYNSTQGVRSYVVSFKRPYALYQGRGDYPRWEAKMAQWLESQGYAVEYCTDIDTHRFPNLEENYDLFLSVGHDEYWSDGMRNNIEARIARGGATAFFGGNTCWWQIRFQGLYDRIVCYKSKALDPLTGLVDHLVTVNWFDDPVFRPENSMTGVSFRNGGYVNAEGWYPASEGYGDYTVTDSAHWVYAGTGLQQDEEFGYGRTIVGFETDGALFTWVDRVPVPTGLDGTPPGFEILGLSPASYGHATMGVFAGPGLVFNAATTDWADGLNGDPAVAQITRNVLDVLLAGSTSVAGGHGAPASGAAPALPPGFTLAASSSPTRAPVNLDWSAAPGTAGAIAVYSVDGRLVTEFTLDPGAGRGRVVWDGRDPRGGRAAPGVYHAVLTGAGRRAASRFVLVR